MTDISHVHRKREIQTLFEIRLDWLQDDKGILTSNEVKDTIHVALPPAFGGEKDQWSPEHLLLGAISSCYMTTYLVFAKKMDFTISHFECQTIGTIEMVNGKYEFTVINVYPRINITDESCREKAITAMQKTQKYCLVSNSLKANIIYHGEVLNEKYIRHYKRTESSEVIENKS